MRFIDAETTRRHLGAAQLIEALRQMFINGCEVPLRHTHTVGDGTLLLMPAWRAGQRLGIKTVTIFPGNSALGQPGLHSTYLLFDAATGVPLAQLDGDQITVGEVAMSVCDGKGATGRRHHRPEHRAECGDAVLGPGKLVVARLVPDDQRRDQGAKCGLIAGLDSCDVAFRTVDVGHFNASFGMEREPAPGLASGL